jgi:hypothetical protein
MAYSLDVKGDNIVVDLVVDQVVVDAETVEYAVTLSRAGSQGSQGVQGIQGPIGETIVSAAINNSNELIFTMSDASQINAGNVITALGLKPLAQSASLGDVETGTLNTGLIQGGTF